MLTNNFNKNDATLSSKLNLLETNQILEKQQSQHSECRQTQNITSIEDVVICDNGPFLPENFDSEEELEYEENEENAISINSTDEKQLSNKYIFNSVQFYNETMNPEDEEWKPMEEQLTKCVVKKTFPQQEKHNFSMLTHPILLNFSNVFSPEMVKMLVTGTNEKANEHKEALKLEKLKAENPTADKFKFEWVSVDEVKMYTFLAFLVYVGASRSKCRINYLFADKIGLPFVRACFSREMFNHINSFMRCDFRNNFDISADFIPFFLKLSP